MTQKLQIKTGKSLGIFIEESIKQALYQRGLTEKEKEVSLQETDDDDKALKTGDVTVDDIIDHLNQIRSGRSFRDDSIKSNMTSYVESLSTAEKTALLAFIKGISQIVTGEISATKAADPSDHPSNVKMKKDDQKSDVKHIKPNVIKLQKPEEKKSSNAEDTSAPVPIVPKKK